jgi:hypothetical protein
VLAFSGTAIVVVLAIVGAISLGNNKAVNLSTNHAGASTPSNSAAAGGAPSGGTTISPLDSTTTAPLDASTTSPLTPTTTPPITSGSGGSGGTSPAPANAAVDVAIIGDSISEIATPDLTRALRQYNLYIDAVGGTKMAEHLAKIEHLETDGQSRDWVIELGTNDVLSDNPNWEADFANEVAALQAQSCVVLVTVNPRLGSISLAINEAIAGAVAAHPNFHALDWGSIELNKSKWLLTDGIHPSKSGSAELARLARRAILGCQGG